MTLLEKQFLFSRSLAALLMRAREINLDVTIGEVWRPPFTATHMASTGAGISNSLHCMRLAVDINIFRNGTWLTSNTDFASLGEFWKSLNPLCSWGGDFGDGNHFSVTHNGVR